MLCFKHVIARLNDSPDSSKEIAAMIFPLLLIIPKVLSFFKSMFCELYALRHRCTSLCVSVYPIFLPTDMEIQYEGFGICKKTELGILSESA